VNDWRPIETAPRGTLQEPVQILVWVANGGIYHKGQIAFGRVTEFESGNIIVQADDYLGHWNITHWMPLPQPPMEESKR
jgi:Protein of unknown function (DUF551)